MALNSSRPMISNSGKSMVSNPGGWRESNSGGPTSLNCGKSTESNSRKSTPLNKGGFTASDSSRSIVTGLTITTIFRRILVFTSIAALAALCIFTTPGTTFSIPQSDKTKGEKKTLTVEDVLNIEYAGEFDISSDGHLAVWIKTTTDEKKNIRRKDIYLTDLLNSRTWQLTRDSGKDSSPLFSPRDSSIAFLRGKEKGKTQIYAVSIHGGEPDKLTQTENGVKDFQWLNPGEIIFSAREDSTLREIELKKNKDDVIVVDDQKHYPPVRLFRVELESKKVKRLTINSGEIEEFAISPLGDLIVTNENQSVSYTYDHRIHPRQFLMDLETGERKEIFTECNLNPSGFKWSSNGDGFYCRRRISSDTTDTYVGIWDLNYYSLTHQRLSSVFPGWKRGLGRSYFVFKDGVIAQLADGTRDRIARAVRSGLNHDTKIISSPEDKPIRLLGAMERGKKIIIAQSDASTIPEIQSASIGGREIKNRKNLIRLNDHIRDKSLASSEVISWTGALNQRVEGILYYPTGYSEKKHYPLMVVLHGGPSGVDYDFFTERWSNYPHLLAGRGMFVLKVNYHGSGNYGLEWVESIKEHYYQYEVPDIISGVNHLLELDLVDRKRVGIMGWSNGSILAIACCMESDIFRVLCAGAGDVNWTSDYGNCAFGAAFDNAYLGGPPWDMPEEYVKKSPLFRIRELHTPTLIMFGTKDRSVPTEQGWQHFRAMQQIGQAPVRFILFPGQGHGPSKISHRKRKMKEELSWLDRYLLESFKPKDESLKKNSPLHLMIKRKQAKCTGELYGERINGILVPETVAFSSSKIGRFEVTRAQFAEFSNHFNYSPGKGNYPAVGVTYQEASDYCEWLSEKTGRNFRLPQMEEMQELLDKASSNRPHENNMDYWAGYSPTPDEREALLEKIDSLEVSGYLIKEAGSFRPFGPAMIFDLWGNVAEWAIDQQGDGKIMGGSATSPADPRTETNIPPRQYRGFRVWEEK